MEAQNFIFYCFFVASSNAFSLLPSFLDPTSAIIQNEDYDTLKTQNQIPLRNMSDDNLILDLSADENVVAEPASAVLSHLRKMLDSPFEDAKEYASEKVAELVSNLEHNSNKVIRFTLGGVHLLVDLGIRGSPARLRNIKQGKSLMEYIGEFFAWCTTYIGSWFTTTVPTDKRVNNKNHTQTENNKAADSKPDKDTPMNQPTDEKHHTEDDSPENSSTIDRKSKKSSKNLNDKNDSNQPEEIKNKEKKDPILKLTPSDIFIPPKELTTEEKNDVEKARQRIITIEKTIHELDEKIRPNELKDRLEMMKKFIRISTSEHIK